MCSASQLVAKLLHHKSSCASRLEVCAQCLKSHEKNCVFQLVARAKCHNKSNEFAFRLIVGFIQKFQSRLQQDLVDLSLSNAFSIAKLDSINTPILCNTFALLVCEPAVSNKPFRSSRLDRIKSKMPFTFQLIVGSKQLYQGTPQRFLVYVWLSNAISNYGPHQHESRCASLLAARAKCLNSHESSCASLLAVCAKCLNSHESGCASLLAARAKSRSEVQRHIKFIVEYVSEGAWNAPTIFKTFSSTVAFTSGAQSALASPLTIFANQTNATMKNSPKERVHGRLINLYCHCLFFKRHRLIVVFIATNDQIMKKHGLKLPPFKLTIWLLFIPKNPFTSAKIGECFVRENGRNKVSNSSTISLIIMESSAAPISSISTLCCRYHSKKHTWWLQVYLSILLFSHSQKEHNLLQLLSEHSCWLLIWLQSSTSSWLLNLTSSCILREHELHLLCWLLDIVLPKYPFIFATIAEYSLREIKRTRAMEMILKMLKLSIHRIQTYHRCFRWHQPYQLKRK